MWGNISRGNEKAAAGAAVGALLDGEIGGEVMMEANRSSIDDGHNRPPDTHGHLRGILCQQPDTSQRMPELRLSLAERWKKRYLRKEKE